MMFTNLQIRPPKPHRRKSSMAARSGVNKRRVSQVMTSVSDIPSMSFMEDLFGEEFPEAFGSAGAKSGKSILDLPAELLAIICEDLSRLDIKRLRLANNCLAQKVDLRIDRVYVSPNRANLQCLRKIMDHPRYKNQVLEVVWDDAQLDEYEDLESFRSAVVADEHDQQRDVENFLKNLVQDDQDDHDEYGAFGHDELFDKAGRLTDLAKDILLRHDSDKSRDIIARNATVMSIEESYEIYQELYDEEQEAMEQGYDAAALRHVLSNCPKLERIVLTSEVWRPWQPRPVYHTPFHRSLPPGFRKPSVWPWLSHRPHSTLTQIAHRNEIMSSTIPNEKDSLPTEFRGYSIITSTLITIPNPKITEFIIYTAHEPIGISHHLFATPNLDYTNTLTMARTIPLKRLQLAFNSYGSVYDHSRTDSYLTSSSLHPFLSALPYLEHLDLAPNCAPRLSNDKNISSAFFYPSQIIPESLLARLKTFALRNVHVGCANLLSLLTSLTSVQYVTLDNVRIPASNRISNYYYLFDAVRGHLDGHQHISRPVWEVVQCMEDGRKRMVNEELCEWVYAREGEVFDKEGEIVEGVGWVLDDWDEEFVVRASELMRGTGRGSGESGGEGRWSVGGVWRRMRGLGIN